MNAIDLIKTKFEEYHKETISKQPEINLKVPRFKISKNSNHFRFPWRPVRLGPVKCDNYYSQFYSHVHM